MTMPDPQSFAEWIKTNPPPDLQELIARFGGYNRITPEAWAEWDAANEAWQAARKARLTRGGAGALKKKPFKSAAAGGIR